MNNRQLKIKIWYAAIWSAILLTFFSLKSQYSAYWGLVFFAVGVILFPALLIQIIGSVRLWLKNRSEVPDSYKPLLIYLAAIGICFCLPNSDRSKQYFKSKTLLESAITEPKDKLYLEIYCISTGFLATDVDAEYLTDDKNFRLFLGTYDEGGEHIGLELTKDSLSITNPIDTVENMNYAHPNLPNQRVYNLLDLQHAHKFD